MRRARPARLRMPPDLLRERERFRPPFRLHHPPVLPPGAAILRCRRVRIVFPREDAARERAVREHAQPEIGAGRQMLRLDHPVERVIIGLAHHRPVDAELVAQPADLGHAPGAVVGDAEIADLPVPHEIAHRPHGLAERRLVILLVEVVDVDVVGAEPAQARLRRAHHPFARQPAAIRVLSHAVAELGRQHPLVALRRDRAPRHLFRHALGIGVRGIDEVHPRLARQRHDAPRRRLVGRPAEIHRAETERRNLEPAAAEIAIFHAHSQV